MVHHYLSKIVFAAGWLYWLFFLLSLTTLVTVFFLRERKIRRASAKEITKHHAQVNLEIHAFQAHMDPHFIFNSLNAIHYYILSTSTDMASLYLTRFSRLMRLMIGNFNKEWVSLQDDLEALALYIELEQLRFEGRFTYNVLISPEVDQQSTFVPPLIIQPYVQYAIWNQLLQRPQKSGGFLQILIGKEDERLLICLEDNGNPGLEMLDATGERQAAGIDIAAERLYMMSEKYHMQAGIQTKQLLNEQGYASGNQLVISMRPVMLRQSMAG
ncbi:MAG TPA: histidine kinase [Chitinophaga sp.]|uniref:sensor histidine kinase n=1 Tax=Chitinophaga sp. TaxID=1869181 RepID=UPI002CD99EDC|nr:histidine kinase [Chitinophaga sp.]HVI43894.1 histidine kinase [Chitinophaga sp.]